MESFRFKVGAFECFTISDGSLAYADPAPVLFANAPSDSLASALREYGIQLEHWVEWISSLNCLVIQTGEHCILVDTGLGTVDFGPNAGLLVKNLKAEGIEPGDIDIVVLTHAHGDHVGGNTDSEGRAAFPHARYLMTRAEWDFWTAEATLAQPDYEWMSLFVQKSLLPLKDRFQFLEQETEIAPGVFTLSAPGHTPGNLALCVSSMHEQLLCLGDVFAHPVHVDHPDWHFAPDCQPEQAIHTRQRLLERAAVDRALVFALHLDFPGLGYVLEQGGKWKWQPLAATGKG